ncbi:hypothetical protein B9Z55_012790 [Caenorhabditis nigoni]|uniref:F-box domain-containing protein n=1 Tax=Caenorhabditis nigoni TaxID=1611254 RepID=A0A2G5TYU3_9PELO|nr:hypothetical protein B9Z55_012790 [Caenorhabditis nigoni]
MSSDIDKLAEKTANLSIDPVYDTNWCDMPAEIKLECIGKMKFKERMSSDIEHLTDTTEKLAIDPVYDTNWCDMPDDIKLECIRKLEFKERGDVYKTNAFQFYESEIVSLTKMNGKEFSIKLENPQEALKFLNHILKIGVFEHFIISPENATVRQGLINYPGIISSKTIKFNFCGTEIVVAVLQKMKHGVEFISMYCSEEFDHDFDKILEILQIQNVPYWFCNYYHKTDSLHKVARMWIDTQAKVGFTFQVSVYKKGSFEEFSEHFTDRIVSKNEKRVRIRTNNPDCHILLERGTVRYYGYIEFFRLLVISVKMKESEYDDNCKEWIMDMDPTIRCDSYDFL